MIGIAAERRSKLSNDWPFEHFGLFHIIRNTPYDRGQRRNNGGELRRLLRVQSPFDTRFRQIVIYGAIC